MVLNVSIPEALIPTFAKILIRATDSNFSPARRGTSSKLSRDHSFPFKFATGSYGYKDNEASIQKALLYTFVTFRALKENYRYLLYLRNAGKPTKLFLCSNNP